MSTIAVVATGGTIACTTDASGALVPTACAQDLIDSALASPAVDSAARSAAGSGVAEFATRAIDTARLDSSSMTFAQLDALIATVRAQLADPDIDAVVITHGTDSLEDTAIALDLFASGPKPVIITGAQRPFDDPSGDGPENLSDALALAAALTAGMARGTGEVEESYEAPDSVPTGGHGVWIQFGGKRIPAWGARKNHTAARDAFVSSPAVRPAGLPLAPAALKDVSVDIIAAYAGAPGDLVLASRADALVIEALGSGNMSSAMGQAVAKVAAAGRPVVITSRVPEGEISLVYGGAGGGATLAGAGVHSSGYLRAGQARIVLAAQVATGRMLF